MSCFFLFFDFERFWSIQNWKGQQTQLVWVLQILRTMPRFGQNGIGELISYKQQRRLVVYERDSVGRTHFESKKLLEATEGVWWSGSKVLLAVVNRWFHPKTPSQVCIQYNCFIRAPVHQLQLPGLDWFISKTEVPPRAKIALVCWTQLDPRRWIENKICIFNANKKVLCVH